jgi:hypothetical protein
LSASVTILGRHVQSKLPAELLKSANQGWGRDPARLQGSDQVARMSTEPKATLAGRTSLEELRKTRIFVQTTEEHVVEDIIGTGTWNLPCQEPESFCLLLCSTTGYFGLPD